MNNITLKINSAHNWKTKQTVVLLTLDVKFQVKGSQSYTV